ncbi:MAG: ribonuclease P protein component [Bdellovibrionota bacterium]
MNPPSEVPSSLRFPKRFRLRRRPEFTRTMDNGQKIVTQALVMIAVPSHGPTSRIGFIVSKKVGGSVTRNRVRRRLRELFRQLPARPVGMDIVVIARHHAVSMDFETLRQAMTYAMGKSVKRIVKDAEQKAALKPA